MKYELTDEEVDSIIVRLVHDRDPDGQTNRRAAAIAEKLERQRAQSKSDEIARHVKASS